MNFELLSGFTDHSAFVPHLLSVDGGDMRRGLQLSLAQQRCQRRLQHCRPAVQMVHASLCAERIRFFACFGWCLHSKKL